MSNPFENSPLSPLGRELADRLALECGIALTDSELATSLDEAHQRIGPHDGNHGCVKCHRTGQDLRFGVCFDCAL